MSKINYKNLNLENKKLSRLQLKAIRVVQKADVKLVKTLRKSLIKSKTSKYKKVENNAMIDSFQKAKLVEIFSPIEVEDEDKLEEAIANKIDEAEKIIIILSKDINYLTSLINSEEKRIKRIKEENKKIKINEGLEINVTIGLKDINEEFFGSDIGCGFDKPEEEKS